MGIVNTDERAKDRSQERLQLVLDAAGLDLWENNLRTGEVIQPASKTFVELGYGAQEVPALIENSMPLVHPDDQALLGAMLGDLLAGRTHEYRSEFRLLTKSGDWVWYANHGRLMDAGEGRPGERLVGVTFNIDSRKRKEAEIALINQRLEEQNQLLQQLNESLQRLAATDSLTGLANRRTLMELGEKECKRAQSLDHPLSLLMVDIDHFKGINDRWGHMVGDRVICATANACRAQSRDGVDVVARLGGEEFVLMLPEVDEAAASALAERLCAEAAAQQVAGDEGDRVTFTVSLGVATFRKGMSMDGLLGQADKALYQAKTNGRNQVRRFAG